MSGRNGKRPLARMISVLAVLMNGVKALTGQRGEQTAETAGPSRGRSSGEREQDDAAAATETSGGVDSLPDFPIPEEAEQLRALSTSESDRIGCLCTFNLRGNAEQAGDYYRRAFRQRSLAFAEYADESTVHLMGGNDDCSLLVGIFPNELAEGVTVTLTYSTYRTPSASLEQRKRDVGDVSEKDADSRISGRNDR